MNQIGATAAITMSGIGPAICHARQIRSCKILISPLAGGLDPKNAAQEEAASGILRKYYWRRKRRRWARTCPAPATLIDRRECPLLAQSRHGLVHRICPLSGE